MSTISSGVYCQQARKPSLQPRLQHMRRETTDAAKAVKIVWYGQVIEAAGLAEPDVGARSGEHAQSFAAVNGGELERSGVTHANVNNRTLVRREISRGSG